MITYLADECVSMQTVDLVRASGMSVLTIKELGLRATVDEDIFKIAQEKHWVLITTDKGFGNIRTYPPSSHAGIIVIRAHDLKSLQDLSHGAEGTATKGTQIQGHFVHRRSPQISQKAMKLK